VNFTEVLGVAGVIWLALVGADVGELQLVGGGSRMAAIRAAVAAASGLELLAFDANAIGGCLVGVTSQTKTVIKEVRGGIWSSFIDSEGNGVIKGRRSRNSTDFVSREAAVLSFIHQSVCDVLSFVAREAALERGGAVPP
jgi:hypothetical protein